MYTDRQARRPTASHIGWAVNRSSSQVQDLVDLNQIKVRLLRFIVVLMFHLSGNNRRNSHFTGS